MENRTIETDFFDWLSKQVSPAQLSDLYTVFTDIDEFCLSRKILKAPLFQTTDLAILSKVRSTVESDKVFAFKYKKQRKQMMQGMHHYIKYIKEYYPKSPVIDTAVQEPAKSTEKALVEQSQPSTILDLITRDNIPFIDNRNKQGCLWIVGGKELQPFVEECKSMGVLFHFKDNSRAVGGKPAWWTNDEIKPTFNSNTPDADQKMTAKENRSEFISWMIDTGIEGSSTVMHLLYLKKCGEIAAQAGHSEKDIFAIVSFEEILKVQKLLLSDQKFLTVNSSSSNHLAEALALFCDYLHSKERKQPSNQTKNSVSTAVSSKNCRLDESTPISEVLTNEQFATLRTELARQGIRTVGELNKIKLWQFMNRYDLYSIATRQTVFDNVQAILNPHTSTDNAQRYKLLVGEASFFGDTPSGAYYSFCEYIARKYPLRIRGLIGKKSGPNGEIALHKSDIKGCYLKLVNPTAFVPDDLSAAVVIQNASWLFSMCAGVTPVVTFEAPTVTEIDPIPDAVETDSAELVVTSNNGDNDTAGVIDSSSGNENAESDSQGNVVQTGQSDLSSYDKKMISRAEEVVLAADLEGISYDDLRDELDITAVGTKRFVSLSSSIVDIKSRLYHTEAIIDWDEGADRLDIIMEKLMQKNNGYVSSAQLYDYARVDMNMFLNDNDMNDERAVFDMAQYLFSKKLYRGKRYYFMGKLHISKTSEAINSNFDVFRKYASDQGGIFQFADLVEYLNGIGIKAGNLRAQLKLYTEPCFFYIEEGELISAASMQIDKAWKQTVKKALDKLFDDVGDHIILRDIQQIWFDQLPILPQGKVWTPLLLQSILRFWGKEFNSRTIMALGSQSMDTLHTMLVRSDSPIQNFGDAIISYILENGIDKRYFDAEELRSLLVGSRMIRGNELLNNMSKALSGDERFAWDAGGNNVTIRV